MLHFISLYMMIIHLCLHFISLDYQNAFLWKATAKSSSEGAHPQLGVQEIKYPKYH